MAVYSLCQASVPDERRARRSFSPFVVLHSGLSNDKHRSDDAHRVHQLNELHYALLLRTEESIAHIVIDVGCSPEDMLDCMPIFLNACPGAPNLGTASLPTVDIAIGL
jgi:hypothetical protein